MIITLYLGLNDHVDCRPIKHTGAAAEMKLEKATLKTL